MTDEQIIALLNENKTDKAFYKLYKDFPKINKLIQSKGGSKADAEDIFQEALIIFYRKVTESDFKLTAQIGTYLYSVSRFLWNDQLKKKKTNQSQDRFELIDDSQEQLNEAIKKEQQLQKVEHVLDKLSAKCKEIFELFYFKKLSMKSIAEEMKYSSERIARTQKYKCVEQAKKKISLT